MYLSGDASAGDSISFIVRGDNPIARLHGEIRIDRAWSRQWEREKQQDTYRNGIITRCIWQMRHRPLAIIRLGFILFEKIPKIDCYIYIYVYICMRVIRNCSLTFWFMLFLSILRSINNFVKFSFLSLHDTPPFLFLLWKIWKSRNLDIIRLESLAHASIVPEGLDAFMLILCRTHITKLSQFT